MDLFEQSTGNNASSPLAERMRPQTLDEIVGQQHLLGKDKLLRQLIEQDQLSSLILWGPPGTGKTTLGLVIANCTKSRFVFFSAVLGSIKEVREIVAEAKNQRAYHGRKTLLFVDEIHRFNKAQQDAFLPSVEKGDVILIGATTENPSFEVNSALLSRSRVFVLEPLSSDELKTLLTRAMTLHQELGIPDFKIEPDALEFLAEQADGDARIALGALEVALSVAHDNPVSLEVVQEALQKKALLYDKGAEEHYNVISAFIKSLRGSDPNAALYWLARMLEAGEDPLFIVRRMVILASEDIGNADPRALQIALAVQQAVHFVGLPEARINLAQGVTYLATAPKSNASYLGIDEALREVRKSGSLPVPKHVRNAPTKLMKDLDYGKDYKYAHNYKSGFARQTYLPEQIKDHVFYRPVEHGYEQTIKERMARLRQNKSGNDEQ